MTRPRLRPTAGLTLAFASAGAVVPVGVTASAQDSITANSLADLRRLGTSVDNTTVTLSATGGDPHPVTGIVTPGQYWINGDHIADPTNSEPIFLDLSGTGNTYNLGGTTINVDTREFDGFGRGLGHGSTVDVIQITGSRNTVRGINLIGQDIALDTDPNAQRYADWSTRYIELSGDRNTVDGAHVVTRGSRTDTYGLSDAFGKGASQGQQPFIAHRKASAFRVGEATNAVVNDIHLEVNTFGHAFFVQESNNTTLTNSLIEGELFSSELVVARPEYQEAGHTWWGQPIPDDIQLAGGEGGVRVYNGSSGLTVDNVVVDGLRTGFATVHDGGDVRITNSFAYNTTSGFDVGDNTVIENSGGNIANGPLLVFYGNGNNTSIDLELTEGAPVGVDWSAAYFNGNADISITSDLEAGDLPEASYIRLGQSYFENWRTFDFNVATAEDGDPTSFNNQTFANDTNQIVVIGENAQGNVGRSQGGVISNGKQNFYDGLTLVQEGSRLTVTDANGLGNSGTETGAAFDRNNDVVYTGTATAQTFDDNGTVVSDGATLEIQAGIRVEDEKLTITGDGVDGRGALFSRGSNDTGTRFGSSNGGDQSTVFLDGDASIGVGTAGNQLLVGAIQGAGDLTKKGAGTLVIGKASNYDGNFEVEQGHVSTRSNGVRNGLSVAAGASVGQVGNNGVNSGGDVVLDGTLDLNERSDAGNLAASVGRLDGDGRVTVSNPTSGATGTLTLNGSTGDGTFAGTIDGAVSIIKSGDDVQTLSGNLTQTGTTTVNDGALLINGTHTGGGTYTVNGGTLGGAGSISASVRVNDGGTLTSGERASRRTNTLNVGGNLTLAAGSTLVTETNDTESDRIAVAGSAAIAGGLDLEAASGLVDYSPLALLTANAGVTGTFTSVDGVLMGDGTGLAVTYTANTVNVTRARLGDVNLDGDIDIFSLNGTGDAQILTSNLGLRSGAIWSQGDFNGDGDVDIFSLDGTGDAQLLTSNLGFTAAASLNASISFAAIDAGEESDAAGPAADSGTASGTYDPSTGDVVLNIGAGVGVVGLEALRGELLFANLSDALAAGEATASTIAFFDPTGLNAGTFDLGSIVAPGTAVADLGLGFTPLGGESAALRLQVVPEPASLTLLALGGLVLTQRRRRTA